MKYRRGYYKKDGTYVQGHFVNKRSGSLKRKNGKGGCLGLIILFLGLLVLMSCTSDSESPCAKKNCSGFSTQAEAQSTFDSDRDCYSNLDRDNDNIACEN
jgi:hypothetical protein